MKKLILLLVLSISFIACKKGTKETKTVDENQVEVKKESQKLGLHVTFTMVVLNDDQLKLRFTEKDDMKFNSKDFVMVEVSGNKEPQNVVFVLPDNIAPTKMRLNIGKKNKTGSLKAVKFELRDKSFEIVDDKLWKFLNTNNYIEFNKENNTFVGKEIEGRYTPSFNFRPILIQKLEEKIY